MVGFPTFDVVARQPAISQDEPCVVKLPDRPRLVFRSAAEVLIRLGTWRAALDLAMIIFRRAAM